MTELLVVCPAARASGTNGWAPPLASLVTAFLAGRNARTVGAYRQDLEAFRCFLQAPTLDEAAHRLLASAPGDAPALALAYQAHLLERRLQATTVNRRLATLRSLVQFAGTVGRVAWTLDVKNVKTQPYRDTTGPGKTAIRAMLEALQARRDAKAQRDRAALRLLYDLGLRRGEAVALDVADLELTAATVAVLGKGRRQTDRLAHPGRWRRCPPTAGRTSWSIVLRPWACSRSMPWRRSRRYSSRWRSPSWRSRGWPSSSRRWTSSRHGSIPR
jgi:integrase